MNTNCEACGANGKFSILLVNGTHDDGPVENLPRWYLPNQSFRNQSYLDNFEGPQEVWFCDECMRKIEDNLRATIFRIQVDNIQVKVEPLRIKP